MCGNRSTSRMEGESVNSMTSRSMPIPMPAVGGQPFGQRAIGDSTGGQDPGAFRSLGLDQLTEAVVPRRAGGEQVHSAIAIEVAADRGLSIAEEVGAAE